MYVCIQITCEQVKEFTTTISSFHGKFTEEGPGTVGSDLDEGTYVHKNLHILKYTCVCTCIHMCLSMCISMYVYAYIRMYVCMFILMCIYYTYTYVCVYVCICTYVCIYTYICMYEA